MPNETRFCPACKKGTFHTVYQQGRLFIYTCRGGCGNHHKVKYG